MCEYWATDSVATIGALMAAPGIYGVGLGGPVGLEPTTIGLKGCRPYGPMYQVAPDSESMPKRGCCTSGLLVASRRLPTRGSYLTNGHDATQKQRTAVRHVEHSARRIRRLSGLIRAIAPALAVDR